jgi:hypothetical protein
LLDPASFARVLAFAVVFGGIEYRYVNKYEKGWTATTPPLFEKYLFWVITPYHAYFLFPLFAIASFALPVTAWAGNFFALLLVEDMAYFAWRRKRVARGEWTTTLIGSFSIGGYVIPAWWPLAGAAFVAAYWAGF